MFRIIVVPTNSAANAMLSYKTREAAEAAHNNIKEMQKGCSDTSIITQKDDFGSVITIDRRHVSYALFIDVEKSQTLPRPGEEKPAWFKHSNGLQNGAVRQEIITP